MASTASSLSESSAAANVTMAAGAWPNATNTGVASGTKLVNPTTANLPAGVTMTASGDLTISKAGVVLSGFNITGEVYVEAANVTISNCQIISSSYYNVYIAPGLTGITVQNCTIDNQGGGGTGISGQGTFIGNNIQGCVNGINIAGDNSVLEDNYVHGMSGPTGSHFDTIQADGNFSGLLIQHNTLVNEQDQTSVLMLDNYWGPINNVTVDDNILAGGGYTAYLAEVGSGQPGGGKVTNVLFENNHVGPGYYGDYDIMSQLGDSPTMSNNVEDGWTLVNSLNQTRPNTPVIAAWSPDTGKTNDGITDSSKITLTGSAPGGSTIKVYDGSTLLGSVVAGASGSWTYVTAALKDGAHQFTATDTVSGTASAASNVENVTIDTKAPVAPVETSDAIVNGAQVKVSGTAEANSAITIYDNGSTVVATGVANASGVWSLTTSALPTGLNGLAATATDAAGNTSAVSAALDPLIGSVSVAYFLANKLGLDAITGGFSISDTAANVAANLDALAADSHLDAIALTDRTAPTVTISVATAQNDAAALAKITSSHSVFIADTAQHLAGLGASSIASLASDGLAQLQATDADVAFNLALRQALGAANIPVKEPRTGGGVETIFWNASGTRQELKVAGVTGQPYTSFDLLYGANNKASSETWSNATGIYKQAAWNADGTLHSLNRYQISGQPWTSLSLVCGPGGKAASETWSNGQSAVWTYNADGSHKQILNKAAGYPVVQVTSMFSPSNELSAQARDLATGAGGLALSGSGDIVTEGGGKLTVKVGADAYSLTAHATETITAANTTSDTFNLSSGFGHTWITGLNLGGSAGDVLNFKLSMFDPSWFSGTTTASQEALALLNHATGTTETIISDLAGDELTLVGVSKSALASNLGGIRFS